DIHRTVAAGGHGRTRCSDLLRRLPRTLPHRLQERLDLVGRHRLHGQLVQLAGGLRQALAHGLAQLNLRISRGLKAVAQAVDTLGGDLYAGNVVDRPHRSADAVGDQFKDALPALVDLRADAEDADAQRLEGERQALECDMQAAQDVAEVAYAAHGLLDGGGNG